ESRSLRHLQSWVISPESEVRTREKQIEWFDKFVWNEFGQPKAGPERSGGQGTGCAEQSRSLRHPTDPTGCAEQSRSPQHLEFHGGSVGASATIVRKFRQVRKEATVADDSGAGVSLAELPPKEKSRPKVASAVPRPRSGRGGDHPRPRMVG